MFFLAINLSIYENILIILSICANWNISLFLFSELESEQNTGCWWMDLTLQFGISKTILKMVIDRYACYFIQWF